MGSEPLAFLGAFCLDNPHGPMIDKEHIVHRADIGVVFPHRLTHQVDQVDFPAVLHRPARLGKQGINGVTGLMLGVLVFSHGESLRDDYSLGEHTRALLFESNALDAEDQLRRGWKRPDIC